MKNPVYIKINPLGSRFYYSDKAMTVIHRTDGPAIEYANGDKFWWLDGKRHRTDGPAIEFANGTKGWYLDGKCHRTGAPAIELSDGTCEWHQHGKRHRTDGPAIEFADGTKEWYLDGKPLTEKKFLAATAMLELTLDDIATKFGVSVENLKIKK